MSQAGARLAGMPGELGEFMQPSESAVRRSVGATMFLLAIFVVLKLLFWLEQRCLLFGTRLAKPGELLWRWKNWTWSVMKIEETLMVKKTKNDERRDGDDEDEYGSSKVRGELGVGL